MSQLSSVGRESESRAQWTRRNRGRCESRRGCPPALELARCQSNQESISSSPERAGPGLPFKTVMGVM